MTEYIIIVALIALAAIAAYSFFGQTVRNQVAAMSEELSGNSDNAADAIEAAGSSASNASGEGTKSRGLSDYNSGSDISSGSSN